MPQMPRARAGPVPQLKTLCDSAGVTLELRYDTPALDWERESLPIGNGFEGAGVFGGVAGERLVLSDKTL